jgi:hypothetical protein
MFDDIETDDGIVVFLYQAEHRKENAAEI